MTAFQSSTFLGWLAGCTLPLIACLPAQAVVVNILGSDYEVTFTSTSYNANSAAFAAPPAGQMPWWLNSTLASSFASQVYDQLGDGYQTGYGPVFAYQFIAGPSAQLYGITQNTTDINDQLDLDASAPLSAATVYAYASASLITPASASVPAPLPLLGAAAAMAWSRRLRTRITSANAERG
jgi:hypothetical protein